MAMLPVRAPATSGVNVTSIVHEAPAASVPGQADVNAKSPEAVIDAIVSGPLPVLASVIVCGGLVVETVREANVSDVGVSEIAGASATPVPDSVTWCGLPGASLLMMRAPAMLPGMSGVNVTLMAQLAPMPSEAGQALVCPKSPEVKIELMLSGALPAFVSVTGIAALVVNTVCDPNTIVGVDSDTAGTGVGDTVAVTVMGAGFV
jgi:hypothetical protein